MRGGVVPKQFRTVSVILWTCSSRVFRGSKREREREIDREREKEKERERERERERTGWKGQEAHYTRLGNEFQNDCGV